MRSAEGNALHEGLRLPRCEPGKDTQTRHPGGAGAAIDGFKRKQREGQRIEETLLSIRPSHGNKLRLRACKCPKRPFPLEMPARSHTANTLMT